MVVHNPNNWHWVEKNCLPWTKTYLNENIPNTTYEDSGFTFSIDSVNSVTGDCDVTQRKGKVLCIYDISLSFKVSGTNKSTEETINGTIILNEFVHDQETDEYVFIIDCAEKAVIKKNLVPLLITKLSKFQGDLIQAHENDVQHSG